MSDDLSQLGKLTKFFDMGGCVCDANHYDENGDDLVYTVSEVSTDSSKLKLLYEQLPARFPKLFETLIMNFRWDHFADTEICRFFPNPEGEDFSGLLHFLNEDQFLTNFCLKHGYLSFAKGTDANYDRFCFDLNRPSSGDFPVVQIDHEEVLSFTRIGKPVEWAPSFRQFVELIIEFDRTAVNPGHFRI